MGAFDQSQFPLALYLPPAGSDPAIIVCLKETHNKTVTFTSNPVEQGSPVTDHARPEPNIVTLECMASLTQPHGRQQDGYTGANELWESLSNLMGTPALVRAVTLGGDYVNMGVESLSRPVSVDNANALAFTLSLKQIRVVQNKFTRVVIAKAPQAHVTYKYGAVQTNKAAAADAANVSKAFQISGLPLTGG